MVKRPDIDKPIVELYFYKGTDLAVQAFALNEDEIKQRVLQCYNDQLPAE